MSTSMQKESTLLKKDVCFAAAVKASFAGIFDSNASTNSGIEFHLSCWLSRTRSAKSFKYLPSAFRGCSTRGGSWNALTLFPSGILPQVVATAAGRIPFGKIDLDSFVVPGFSVGDSSTLLLGSEPVSSLLGSGVSSVCASLALASSASPRGRSSSWSGVRNTCSR